MIKFQLYYTDEYNQSVILSTSTELSKIIEEAKKKVTDDNVNNSLTIDDKKRNWESYFVEIPASVEGEPVAIYAGKDRTGKNSAYLINKDGVSNHELSSFGKDCVKVYLGKLDGKDWYATDGRNNEITDLGNENLNGKSVYYIKAISG